MTHPPFVIIVATCGRKTLLNRLLDTLAVCDAPPNRTRILIAENGASSNDRTSLRRFAGSFPIEHRHTRQSNKSLALNEAIAASDPEHFAVFFDDDVRVHPQTLRAYSEAIETKPHPAFFGGQCLVDYDRPPQTWLIPYLPASAKGWSLGPVLIEFKKPHALGFNWCARVGDLRRCGGFDMDRGPGTPLSIGEESAVQHRLMAAGATGYYVPNATVSHYVPAERCSEGWALQRALQNGFARGLSYDPHSARTGVTFRYRLKQLRSTLMLLVAGSFLPPEKRFHYEYWKMRHSGMLAGLRIAACRLPSSNAHAA